ncbi:MAG: hypothetical protein ACD_49C00085G0017 [uncultured bacterium (gcode 4)]|uniref:Uncharacterized protein n=1 Tax=uncultured bacterium (gcode 4) TaxID=1234023 RepID=K2AVA6_9BACT|nr:MAG: hypothetical protein ACD_49C00085G0017 [uncultured bacterium (gcode 4)]
MKNKLWSLALLAGLVVWVPSFAIADTQANTCGEVERIFSWFSKENLVQIKEAYSIKIKWTLEIERHANEENEKFVACVDTILKKNNK